MNKKRKLFIIKPFIITFAVLGVAFLLYSCQSAHHRAHLWSELHEEGEEENGYGMYTYVLINRCLSGKVSSDASERYKSLVYEIMESTVPSEGKGGFNRGKYNLFLIPARTAKQVVSDSLEVKDFDQKHGDRLPLNERLSMRLLNAIAITSQDEELSRRIRTSAGPFLISALRPISDLNSSDGSVSLLYVDLSNTNPKAMAEVVAAYKERTVDDEPEGVERFGSLRLSFLNVTLNAEEAMRNVKVNVSNFFEGANSDASRESHLGPISSCRLGV